MMLELLVLDEHCLHRIDVALAFGLRMFLTTGQCSDYIGARALLDALPPAKHMLADRGYDADWYREALEGKGIKPCIPSHMTKPAIASATKSRTE